MKGIWQEANSHLENGVIAEFESKLNINRRPDAKQFHNALEGYLRLKKAMIEYDKSIQALQKVDSKCDKIKIYEETLSKIFAEGRPLPRLTKSGVRYADAAGLAAVKVTPITNTTEILAAWRVDLKILQETLDEVIKGLRDALPLAEKGEFAAVMLSGRNAFGDKMPQFTEMFSAYKRLYVRTVMATIAATMQVYPVGYEWLNKPSQPAK